MSFRTILRLTKIKIAILSSATAGAGYLLAKRGAPISFHDPGYLLLGTLLLAGGAASLNQYQERDTDALMERTRGRPIPAGEISPSGGLAVALVLIAAGLAILIACNGVAPFLLGSFAVAWYNGVYTNLKKVTPFAVIPGALVGAVPPAMGWAAGGGDFASPRILLLCAFFFLWQIPHFWLIILRYGKEYERAGLPSLSEKFGKEGIKRITLVWMVATGVASLAIPLFDVTGTMGAKIVLAGAAVIYFLKGISILRGEAEVKIPSLFRTINGYALLLTILIAIDALI